jgi:hypothetical protein
LLEANNLTDIDQLVFRSDLPPINAEIATQLAKKHKMLHAGSNVCKCSMHLCRIQASTHYCASARTPAPVEVAKLLQLSSALGVHQLSSIALSAALVSSSLLLCPSATAHVAIDRLPQQEAAAQQNFSAGFDPVAAARGGLSDGHWVSFTRLQMSQ